LWIGSWLLTVGIGGGSGDWSEVVELDFGVWGSAMTLTDSGIANLPSGIF